MTLCTRLWRTYLNLQTAHRQSVRRNQLSAAGRRGMWRRWNREQAILERMPEVEKIAKDVKRMFARHIDLADLVQAGHVGLVRAANSFHPSKAGCGFESYAYFAIRGAIIDSQKRRAYREERNESLNAIADRHQGWLPPALDTCNVPRVDAVLEAEAVDPRIQWAISGLTGRHAAVFAAHAEGVAPRVIAEREGLSLSSTRTMLREAREFVAHRLESRGVTR